MRKNLLLLPILAILVLANTSSVFSATTYTTGVDRILNKEDLIIDEVIYRNNSDKTEIIKVSASAYDAKNEQILTTKPFIAFSETKYTIAAKKEVKIRYAASIPSDTPAGTYFNVILFEKTDSKGKSLINIVPAQGVLFAFHVQDGTTTINQIFFDQSDVNIIVERKGIPFLSKTVFLYSYKNNSNYVFRPSGEIRILDANDNQIMERMEINPEGKAMYPGMSIEQRFEVSLWTDIKDILKERNIVSKTYGSLETSPILNKVTVNILYPLIIFGSIALLILGLAIYLIISSLKDFIVSRKEKAPKK